MKEEQSSHVKITLFTKDIYKCYIEKFVGETLNCAVLDSGCTKNVCGKTWLDSYLNTLTEKDAQKVLEESSSSSFRFGDGNSKTVNKSVTIPARIGNQDIMIKTDVIDSDLPLLLSKEAIKKGDVKIDFARDKVSFLNQNVDIVFTSSSHYAIPISRTEQLLDHYDKNNESERALLTIHELSSKSPEEKKIAKKLHCQFGHSSAEKLKELLRSANIWDQELNREIYTVKRICDICLKYKKPKLRPAVGFS